MSGQTIVDGGAPQLRRVALLLAAVAALVLAGAGIAFACTGRASLTGLQPKSAKPGTLVTVSGESWHDGPVELRWENPRGQKLGDPTGPTFSENVRIPDVEDGTYSIVAVAYYQGTHVEKGRDSLPFKVSSGDPYASGDPSGDNSQSPPSESGDPSGSETRDPSGQDSPEQNSESSDSSNSTQNTASSSSMNASGSRGSEGMTSRGSSSSPSEESASSSSPSQGSTASSSPSEGSTASSSPSRGSTPSQPGASQPDESPQQVGAPDEARGGQPAGRQQERQSVGQQPSQAPAPEPGQSAAPQPERQPQPAAPQPAEPQPAAPAPSSSESSQPGDEAAGDAGAEAATESDAAEPSDDGGRSRSQAGRADTEASRGGSHPSARSGSGDLWSGFDAGDETLSPGFDQPATGSQDGGLSQQLALAVGLFGAGALALMGGGFAAFRRRRAPVATAGSRRDV